MDNRNQQKNKIPNWLVSFDELRAAIKKYQFDRSLSMLSTNIKIIAKGDQIEYTIEEDNEQI
jgi:hypothetical protein